MENVATTSVCTNGKYDANLAATVKGLLETTSAQSLIHTWVQDQPHYLQLNYTPVNYKRTVLEGFAGPTCTRSRPPYLCDCR